MKNIVAHTQAESITNVFQYYRANEIRFQINENRHTGIYIY